MRSRRFSTELADGEVVEQQMLTPGEMYVLEELFKTYPEYYPSEVLLSAMTGQSIERCQEKVLWGLEGGANDAVMRPTGTLPSEAPSLRHGDQIAYHGRLCAHSA